jgi:chromatin remodeling complex protein RSC6
MLEAKKKAPRANNALSKPVQPSSDLAAIVGDKPIARSDVVSKMWEYIKKNNLQNPENKREIVADDKLKKVFGGKDKVSMFEMNKHLSNHLKLGRTPVRRIKAPSGPSRRRLSFAVDAGRRAC